MEMFMFRRNWGGWFNFSKRRRAFNACAVHQGVQNGYRSFKGPSEPWSYIASWKNGLTVGQSAGSSLRVEVDLEVSGSAEIGLLARDFTALVTRASVSGRRTVTLDAPEA